MSDGLEKVDLEAVEELRSAQTRATEIGNDEVATLSQAHKDYLVKKHGSLDIDPVPAFGDADPYNWPNWKARTHLCSSESSLTRTENHKPCSRSLARLHVVLHRRCNYSRLC